MILAILILYALLAILIIYEAAPIVNKWCCVPKEKCECMPPLPPCKYCRDRFEKKDGDNMLKRTGEPVKTTSGSEVINRPKHNFKVGDRVRGYSQSNGNREYIFAGKIVSFCDGTEIVNIGNNGVFKQFHVKQLRRIKPRAKSIRITKEEFEKAWLSLHGENYGTLYRDRLWDELTKTKETK